MALSVAPLTQVHTPAIHPAALPKASSTHATVPDASGYADPSSAVIKASGTDQKKGAKAKAKIEYNGPADRTVASIPNGPP